MIKLDLARNLITFSRFLSLKFFNLFNYNFNTLEKITIGEFTKYQAENNINERYKELIQSIDYKSKNVVDTVLFRLLSNKRFLFAHYFSTEELKQTAKESFYYHRVSCNDNTFNTSMYKNLYPNLGSYEVPVFKFHHGLILLDKKILEYLNNKDAIDGGGYNLESSIIFSCHYPFNKIYSFEIDEENYKKGLKILKEFYPHLKNIVSINKGLWNKDANLQIVNKGTVGTSINISNNTGYTSNLTSIDNFAKSSNLNLGYIKMDIEGSEYNAILGAKVTIKKFLPVMSISIYHNFKDFFEIKPLIESIAPGEYEYYIRKLAPFYSQHETYLICIPKKLNIKIYNLEDINIYG